VTEVAHLPHLTSAADLRDLLLGAAGGQNGHSLRDEVIASVAVLDLDEVTGTAEIADFLSENELHPEPQRAVLE
jgi:hypothetical protein